MRCLGKFSGIPIWVVGSGVGDREGGRTLLPESLNQGSSLGLLGVPEMELKLDASSECTQKHTPLWISSGSQKGPKTP